MELDRTKMTLAEHHNMAAASLDNITEQGTIADNLKDLQTQLEGLSEESSWETKLN